MAELAYGDVISRVCMTQGGEIGAILISTREGNARCLPACLPEEKIDQKYTRGNNLVKMIMTARFKEIASDEDDANGEIIYR